MLSIPEAFGKLSLTIDKSHVFKLEKMLIYFLSRETHPLTFNGMTLGVHPIAFKDADYNALFDLFQLKKQDVEKTIRQCQAIDRNFAVTSDPYNLLIFWLFHLAPQFLKEKQLCQQFQFNLIKFFLLKVFCSVTNNSFRYGANESIMMVAISELTLKSDVIRLGSWDALLDSHAERLIDPKDRFYKILVNLENDDAFLRVIAETQTSIRAKIVTFAQNYYLAHSKGDRIDYKSSVAQNAEGEKILAQTASVIDSATQGMIAELLNSQLFVNDVAVTDVANLYKSISARMLKMALLKINETAIFQTSQRQFDEIKQVNNKTIYVGLRVLTIELIRSMISVCRKRRVNMGNKALVFETMRNIYTSSRTTDPDILNIKNSVSELVDSFKITSVTATSSTLKLAVISYLLYRTIDKMK